MAKDFVIQKFDTGMYYLTLPKQFVQKFVSKGEKRVLCTINKAVTFHAAILSTKEGMYFIQVGATNLKKLHLKVGSIVNVELAQDESLFQFSMPEELQEVLNLDEAANQIFSTLTPGNQRSLMYLVSQVKSVDKRIERALKIAQQIKLGHTSAKTILR